MNVNIKTFCVCEHSKDEHVQYGCTRCDCNDFASPSMVAEAKAAIRAATRELTKPCRTCSECDGDHHWIEGSEVDGEGSDGEPMFDWVGFVCKHCDARREQCLSCEGVAEIGEDTCSDCAKDLS